MIPQVRTTLEVRHYEPSASAVWNAFIDQSANGTFLFRREFMEYHADRFEDHSYLVWRKNELVAVFVAGRSRTSSIPTTLVAHPGLTYGGLVYATELKYALLEEVYDALFTAFRADGFTSLLVKPVARVFCRQPAEASLFYFHQQGFALQRRELNSVIDLTQPLRISKGRKDNVRKARNAGVTVAMSNDFSEFWPLLVANLWQTHGVRPPHSEAEIRLLQQQFPDNIQLYVARYAEAVVGGVLLFLDAAHGFVHTQYISANEQGKQVGAVDAIIAQVLTDVQGVFPRFSFGISTAEGELNAGLLAQKEGFGATVELIDTYEKAF
ncbi:GNAT family N-acetyltransferase [Hymenobacter sp. BT523]|uniref:GNAT family N-acetyltransferase n=1 Tax=Hymenobacter sp. BT523 TaxID=2795725 RepID=UPI0018EB9392|nr:GNAT family N-acetyltransferase [Hymenobacter sp. BT523]MBJ6108297.1 GNAT family N-acetyltransferase [Hymenobacter sp. BT523]